MILPLGNYAQNDTIAALHADSTYFKLKYELKKAEEQNDPALIARKLIEFGDFYQHNEAVNQAVLNYQKAADFLPENDTALVYIQLQSGKIEFRLKQYQRALSYFTEGLELSRAIGYKRGEAMCAGYVGSCYEKLHSYDKAIVNQQISLDIFKQLGDPSGLALTNENLGSIYEDLGAFDKALGYFKEALF